MTVLKEMNDSSRKNANDNADVEKTAHAISSQEIKALMVSEEPVDMRLDALKGMKTELEARLSADHGEDLAPLIEEIDNAIDSLSSAGGEAGVRSPINTQ